MATWRGQGLAFQCTMFYSSIFEKQSRLIDVQYLSRSLCNTKIHFTALPITDESRIIFIDFPCRLTSTNFCWIVELNSALPDPPLRWSDRMSPLSADRSGATSRLTRGCDPARLATGRQFPGARRRCPAEQWRRFSGQPGRRTLLVSCYEHMSRQ